MTVGRSLIHFAAFSSRTLASVGEQTPDQNSGRCFSFALLTPTKASRSFRSFRRAAVCITQQKILAYGPEGMFHELKEILKAPES
jgi:hypothetical protein